MTIYQMIKVRILYQNSKSVIYIYNESFCENFKTSTNHDKQTLLEALEKIYIKNNLDHIHKYHYFTDGREQCSKDNNRTVQQQFCNKNNNKKEKKRKKERKKNDCRISEVELEGFRH